MKICGFSCLYNELENKNLLNWITSMQNICDYIYIFDQASSDGSSDVYSQHSNISVFYNGVNDFLNEIKCKKTLLEKLLTEQPDTDWIFWMDGDTIADKNVEDKNQLHPLLDLASTIDYDAVSLGHLNIYRSDLYYRIDSEFDYFDNIGITSFWKNKPGLAFELSGGIHKPQFPTSIKNVMPALEFKLLHRSHVLDENIAKKYKRYLNLEKIGIMSPGLPRLIKEDTLTVKKVPDIYPSWFHLDKESDPMLKPSLEDFVIKHLMENE